MKHLRRLAAALMAAVAVCGAKAETDGKTRVACVGNSITFGYLIPDREQNSYPAQLARMLGEDFEVGNFGHSGTTLLERAFRPYVKVPEYQAALDFGADVVVIHLGVNDTDPRAWPNYGDEFITDYVRLIGSFRERNPQARIIIARLSPLRASHHRFRTGTRDWRLEIQRAIEQVAEATGAELIDFDAPLRDRQNLITDGIHPDAEGAGVLARTVYGAITGNYGGLRLPEVWQSGMVIQRGRPLPLRGSADAGRKVTVTFDGRNYRAVANNRGEWAVTLAPAVAGRPYTLTVTDGDSVISLADILAGEVWIASGQSNMAFPLASSVGGPDAVAASADSLLRFYHQEPIALTDNVTWSDSVCAAMDTLGHYRPARWEPVAPANAGRLSAVAYYFARQLRDSLQVPVGVIANAVGGSGAEAWIDVNTLEAEMPEILVNWRTNDYLQPWVRGRIDKNIGNRPGGRHPYEPSYLFSAAMRPLADFPVAGTIWYQGESNAHNIELHEQLFPLLVESWRRELRQPEMPFYFVQLSSIDRPSWPAFRNSQRRLAETIPGTGMAVSSDLGDSLDVHPRRKFPVGQRLARLALNRSYGFADIEDCGPSLLSATAAPGSVVLTFGHADGLATADGAAPGPFEIAGPDGIFRPAGAKIIDNTVILSNMDVKTPRFVRYAWQPFTRANLVNGAGLPASTFKAEVDNAADFLPEPGFEYGVSAAFCGLVGSDLVIAGGANFPCADPLAPEAKKVTYRGIYAASTSDPALAWRRVGSLPGCMAYGASAQTPRGPVFVGTDRRVWLLGADFALTPLASMPASVDNAAAAAIGNTVYVCGGNVDGKPSRELFALNLDSPAPEWKKLRSMPGNPRVQPVMAAVGSDLYVWGGFAGSGKDATLETSGLRYSTASGKWSPLPAPADAGGTELTLSGGAAVALPDGRIAALGGVNKDVFLAAIRCQAPDYLLHPVEWYRFNPNVVIFNPADGKWTVAATTPDAARAGACVIAAPGGDVYVYGGELKPRIRTSETTLISIP